MLDALVTGLPSFGLILCIVLALAGGISVLRSMVRADDRPLAPRIIQSLLAFFTAVAIIGAFKLNAMVGHANARKIISAVEKYETANGSYPDHLEDLIPEYLDSVPASCYRLLMCDFMYTRDQHGAFLFWVQLPPFGRPTYDFGTRRWGYLD